MVLSPRSISTTRTDLSAVNASVAERSRRAVLSLFSIPQWSRKASGSSAAWRGQARGPAPYRGPVRHSARPAAPDHPGSNGLDQQSPLRAPCWRRRLPDRQEGAARQKPSRDATAEAQCLLLRQMQLRGQLIDAWLRGLGRAVHPRGRVLTSWLVKYHYLRDECIYAPRVPQITSPRDRAKVLLDVARIIRFVKILWE